MTSDNQQARLPGAAQRGWFGKILAVAVSGVLILLGLTFSMLLLAIGTVGGLLAWGLVRWKLRQLRKQMEAQLAAAGDAQAAVPMHATERMAREARIIEGEAIRDSSADQPPR